jgi:hypothetical protein
LAVAAFDRAGVFAAAVLVAVDDGAALVAAAVLRAGFAAAVFAAPLVRLRVVFFSAVSVTTVASSGMAEGNLLLHGGHDELDPGTGVPRRAALGR